MKMLQHFLLSAFVGAIVHIPGQSIDSTLDSWRSNHELMGLENKRSMSPGEPLLMAPDGVLKQLLDMDLDQFRMAVDIERYPGKMKSIHYLKSETGLEVLFVEGDLRYITYDMKSLENASQSGVVGFDHWGTPYIYNDQLFFQNGLSNWYIHSNRYYHSRVNGEIERSHIDPWPEGAEYSVALVGDSSSFLLPMQGLQDNWNEPGIVHSLRHDASSWSTAGQLNIGFQRLETWKTVFHLQDYWVMLRDGEIDVIRKSDLHVTKLKSEFGHIMKSSTAATTSLNGLASLVKGNRIGCFKPGEPLIMEDIDALSQGATWTPLVIPLDPEPAQEVALPMTTTAARNWLLILVGIQAVVIGGFWMKRRQRRSGATDNTLEQPEGQPSAFLKLLLAQAGQELKTGELDALFGLDDLESPETRRSRRSRSIQVANLEANALYGRSIIERTKSASDKRIVVYQIQDVFATTGS